MCVEIPVKASQASKSILKRALSIFSQLYTQKKYARVSSYHAKQIKILGLSLIVEYFQMGYYKLKLYCDVKCNYYNININITMKEKEQTSLQNQIISLKRDSLLDMPDRNTRKYLEKVIEIVDELYNSRLEYQTEQNQQIKQINDRISREQNQKKQNQIKDSQRLSKNKQITFQKLSNYLKTTICIAFTVVIGLLIISVIFYQQLDKTDQIPSLLKKMEETEQRVSDQIKKLEREYQEKIQNLQILIFNVRNLNKAQIKQFQMKEGLLKQSILKIAKENNRNKVKQDKIEKVVSTWNDLKKLEKLSLNNSMISQLPQSFFYLKNLKQLNLRGNKLANISHSFEDLKELQVLQIDQNLLTELPKALGHMTKMKRLSASENKLSNLPESFMYLTNLIILNISDNLFSTFPQILAHLSKLEQLFICNNNISMLPQSLLNLTKIKKLYASKNSLQNLPQNLTNLKELQQLSLRRNKLIKLPQSLGNLKELKTLYLQINQLTQLPQSLGNLSKLQTLYIYYNPNLKELPKSFKNLKELKVLYIDWQLLPKQNIFQTEPFASLKNLKKLWVCRMQLDSEEIRELMIREKHILRKGKKVSLWFNNIGEEGVKYLASGNLNNFTDLNLQFNNIGDLEAEHLASGNLTNLYTLDLKQNKLGSEGAKHLGSGNLANLDSLDLKFNNIGVQGAKHLASGNFRNLTYLHLNSNNICAGGVKHLSSGNLTTLYNLDLSDNKIGDEGAKHLALRIRLPKAKYFAPSSPLLLLPKSRGRSSLNSMKPCLDTDQKKKTQLLDVRQFEISVMKEKEDQQQPKRLNLYFLKEKLKNKIKTKIYILSLLEKACRLPFNLNLLGIIKKKELLLQKSIIEMKVKINLNSQTKKRLILRINIAF